MDTIYAALSPLLSSAVIVVRISGSKALLAAKHLSLKELEPRRVYNAKYSGSVTDDVLVTYFRSPSSYTGEDVLEISFHGNPLIVQSAFSDFEKLGMRGAEPGEFTKRAFLNGKIDLTQAESVAELIDSKTRKGIEYSYSQLKGSMRKEVESIRDTFIRILTVIEAHIDFPEEDIADAHQSIVFDNLKILDEKLTDISGSYSAHKILRDGFRIAIIGKPNTGKSSLMNYLLKEDRSIVSEVPGTTRDYIESTLNIGGVPVSLIDTAGVRFTDDQIEKAGIDRTVSLIQDADLVVVLLDNTRPLDSEDKNVLDIVRDMTTVVAVNKCDLESSLDYPGADCMISVKHGIGMEDFLKKCSEHVLVSDSDIYAKSVMVTERQKRYYDEISESVSKLLKYSEIDFDIFEYELNSSLRKLSQITGLSYTEDILSNIFENFCIGK